MFDVAEGLPTQDGSAEAGDVLGFLQVDFAPVFGDAGLVNVEAEEGLDAEVEVADGFWCDDVVDEFVDEVSAAGSLHNHAVGVADGVWVFDGELFDGFYEGEVFAEFLQFHPA